MVNAYPRLISATTTSPVERALRGCALGALRPRTPTSAESMRCAVVADDVPVPDKSASLTAGKPLHAFAHLKEGRPDVVPGQEIDDLRRERLIWPVVKGERYPLSVRGTTIGKMCQVVATSTRTSSGTRPRPRPAARRKVHPRAENLMDMPCHRTVVALSG